MFQLPMAEESGEKGIFSEASERSESMNPEIDPWSVELDEQPREAPDEEAPV